MTERNQISLSKARELSLISLFSTLYAILRLIPTFPMIGIPNASFSASDAVASIYGILLGPLSGSVAVILGTYLAIPLGKPVIFLGLDFLPAMVNTLIVGMLATQKRIWASLLYSIIFFAFLANPLTLIIVNVTGPFGFQFDFPFPWLHALAYIALLSPLAVRAQRWILGSSIPQMLLAIGILTLIGTMAQHLTGGLLFEDVTGLYLGIVRPEAFPLRWMVIFWVYPIERMMIVIVSSILGVALFKALRAAGYRYPLIK